MKTLKHHDPRIDRALLAFHPVRLEYGAAVGFYADFGCDCGCIFVPGIHSGWNTDQQTGERSHAWIVLSGPSPLAFLLEPEADTEQVDHFLLTAELFADSARNHSYVDVLKSFAWN
jgi:hypothetical protein